MRTFLYNLKLKTKLVILICLVFMLAIIVVINCEGLIMQINDEALRIPMIGTMLGKLFLIRVYIK